MIDISEKNISLRIAVASGEIVLKNSTVQEIVEKRVKKGDVFEFARASALFSIKNTAGIIPHAHPVPIEDVEIKFSVNGNRIRVECMVKAHYKTGVEMEALVGVTSALLTIWDMVKYLEKDENGQYPFTSIKNIEVIKKEKI
ncbi:MAG: cyclic pyranopterin monophosphate synthase MoaC [Thermoplasmata archaeon]|jgi:cyclic pyranopterin phosphate synthase|nr:cyclic pyranopterin monophosphate synthase MoaC [Thermoplasmata archaeon]MVT13251.1 cyclic pyranopterin monophosphate synthase MoaC [Euryarchaeota archaeon]MVT14732.1 cyclic pyranopterin monophosphate synthase MoaC [Euryarchaeota archaeon]MVT35972.1 cyclic pyranopterin monophosphate synthase MoaC [Euryarchaeota archaeon]